ncbi:MAG: TlpA disulfide reductase family protein [Planctomycetia bacterium]|nr:TlpA disulfide reductase family protein [Planctomycetia bacterium]
MGQRLAGRADAAAQTAAAQNAAVSAAAQGTVAPAPQTPGVTRPLTQPQTAAQAPTVATPGAATPVVTTTPGATAATAQGTAAQGALPTATPKKSDGSEFVVPQNATPEELMAKAAELFEMELVFETEEEYTAWLTKMLATVSACADRTLSQQISDELFIKAISVKGEALSYQARLDSTTYLPKLKVYADALEKNKRVQSLEDGQDAAVAFKGIYFQEAIADVAERQGKTAELLALMQEVQEFVIAHPIASEITIDLVFPIMVIAENNSAPDLPEKVWAPIRQAFSQSTDSHAKAALQLLDGTIRYYNLPGNLFEWHGLDPQGKPFDKESVAGHVVVVDFWASWCEPSPLLHEQLAELYEAYHPYGFEIVSYNLDADAADMTKYLQEHKLPWIMLSDRATVDAKQTSLAAYYGVTEIPTLILIGGDGKVASVDVDVETLAATLQVACRPKDAASAGATNAASAGVAAGSVTGATTTATGATRPATGAAATSTGATRSAATTPSTAPANNPAGTAPRAARPAATTVRQPNR